jgi:gas vesicle protein
MKEGTIMNKDHAMGFGVGLLTGVVIGGVIALLFAPQSGKETRQMIKDKAAGVADAIKGKATEATAVVDAVKEKTAGVVHALKS